MARPAGQPTHPVHLGDATILNAVSRGKSGTAGLPRWYFTIDPSTSHTPRAGFPLDGIEALPRRALPSRTMMKRMTRFAAPLGLIVALASLFVCPAPSRAQDSGVPKHEALMDRMVGEWVMTGTIAGEQVTHDVHAEWILDRRYVRIHEVSRERDENGKLAYEAWIDVAWDAANAEYVVMDYRQRRHVW